ncbi:MAG: dihydroorotase [Deltaproteobacteria bacterium]|nr:dihydroorotase [Deltaproteobacteria bacterium]
MSEPVDARPRAPKHPELVVFRGARAVDPSAGLDATVDVLVERGRIVRLGPNAASPEELASERVLVVDASSKWLLPAFVDLHAHFREPGQEYKEDIGTGLAAAAAGGFGHVCCMPNTKPINDTRAVTEMMMSRAKSAGGTRLHPIAAITKGQRGEELTEMADLRDAGAVGVSDDGVCVMSSVVMRRALEYARTFDMPVIQHCEDHALTAGAQMHEGAIATRLGLRGWPRVAEDAIVARDLLLAEATGARYHVAHVSTAGSVRLIREAKSRGIHVTAEVTPHHLMLTDEAVVGYRTFCKVNPPLREAGDVEALREALADGTIDAIATDHAPHSPLEKDCEMQEASPGMIGLELVVPVLLELVHSGALPLGRFVDALTRAPAKVVALDAPCLIVGARAELTLVDPTVEHVVSAASLRSKSKNTPFLDRSYRGRVELTMLGDAFAFQRGRNR